VTGVAGEGPPGASRGAAGDAPEAVVRRFFALAEAQDADALAALVSDDAVSHDPVGHPPLVGRPAHREMFAETDDLFTDVAFDVTVLAAQGPHVAVRWTATAGLRAGGRSTFGGIDVFAVAAGLVTGHWAFWDPEDVTRGATPAG
jgi:steroid delta-isomerase